MRILFDRNMPSPLRRFLIGHKVEGTAQLGWSLLKNGDLLKAAESTGFDVMITADQNIAYQQNLKGRAIALVVLGSNRWRLVRNYVNEIISAVDEALPNSYVFIEIPLRRKPPYVPRNVF